MSVLSAPSFVVIALVVGYAVLHTATQHKGTTLAETQQQEVIGKLGRIEDVPGSLFDNSLIVLEDGTRILVKGAYSVYQPGAEVVKSKNAGGMLYCLADQCRYGSN